MPSLNLIQKVVGIVSDLMNEYNHKVIDIIEKARKKAS